MGFTTKAVQTRFLKKDAHGALAFPVYDSVTFEFDSAADIQAAFEGKSPRHVYSRITNPTVEHLEWKVRNVAGAAAVVAVSSGMAAIANAVMAVAGKGDNIITTRFIFGNTYSLFSRTLEQWGLETRYADFSRPETVERLIDERTRAIYFETITNPQLEVAAAEALSAIAKKHGILLLCDTTVTPAYLFDAKKFGIDVEVLSATKYISGGGTSVGGLIIDYGSYDWGRIPALAGDAKRLGTFAFVTKLKREVYRNLGACLSPHNAYLQSMGLETLALRADRSCANALALAILLEEHKKVRRVNYPGLESSAYYSVAKKQFGERCGGLLTFELSSKEECFGFLDKLKIVRRATNINDNKTLALHPASTIFCEYPAQARADMGVPDTLIRISAGIEDFEDLAEDVLRALED